MRICRDILLVKRQSLPGEIHGHQRNYPRIFGAGWPAAAALLVCAAFFACKKDAGAEARPGELPAENLLVLAKDGEEAGFGYANDEAVRLAFTLDYRGERPEPPQEAETLDSAARAGASTAAAVEAVEVIPGLRKLSDYRTAYSTEGEAASPRLDPKLQGGFRDATAERMLNPLVGAGPLTVVDWGPGKFLSSAVRRPSIYVIFSQPMVPLAALGEPSASSPLVSIEPPLKGSFRWYGASFLSFEGDEPCASQQTYTVSVSPEAESIYGIRIEGQRSFTFETERLAMKSVEPGLEFRKKTGFRFSNDAVPPAAAKELTITFNYPVNPGDIKEYITITSGAGGEKTFNLTQVDGSRVLASLPGEVEFDTLVTVTLKEGAKSEGGTLGTAADQQISFRTPGPFAVTGVKRLSPWGKYFNLLDIEFSAGLNEGTALGAIRTEPRMPLTADNIEVWGNTARLSNLSLDFGQKFKIIVDTGVEDVYGRHLPKRYETEITMPPRPQPVGSATFLDWGDSMLEAQFEPRFLFEYKNITADSYYDLEQKNNPWSAASQKRQKTYLQNFDKNYRYFEEIDLRPYLNAEGKGFVSFNAELSLLQRGVDPETGKQKTYTEKNQLTLQVTDLGLTVRYGFNKAVVMVTSLSTGEAVEGATVSLIAPGVVKDPEDISRAESFAEALTDKDGLAVLAMPAGALRNMERSRDFGRSSPFVLAEKDGDRAVFQPSSHNIWRFGVDWMDPEDSERVRPVTFMFSDRGLYKPGETLTFRGVDRSLVLGMYAVYNGDYTVTLVKSGYQGETVAAMDGVTSESGGYYGAIKLDEELTPGEYRLRYSRGGGAVCADIPVTVAYFERLRFQASIAPPAVDVISGDEINLTLEASYLSGGNLSGAEWRASWYRQTSGFYPDTAETKNFVFGPRNVYDGKRYIASSNGLLSADGKAALTQKTLTDSVPGAAYLYSVGADVTDVSNQQISASQSVTVHPALYYIGIERPSRGGFAKAGEELSFNYITVNPSGRKLAGSSQFLHSGENSGLLGVELVREEWKRVQQRGVNNYVYDNYERTEVIDSAEKTAIKTSGSVKVKPSKSGFYTLRLSGFDREGRKVITEYQFYVTGSNFSYWNRNNANEVNLVPDKAVYNPGDTAEVLLQSPLPAGRYLITVEREGIFTEETRVFDEAVSVISVPIARNFVPVVYLSVSSYSTRSGPPVHSYGMPDLDKPKGYYGVVKLFVNPRVRAFSVNVEGGKKVFRPGEEVTLTLTAERDGVPLPNAELSLMAVDRGVLDLIDYHVPDPISYFYDEGLFPLGVRGGDSRAMLMDPVTYSVKNLYGGDAGDKLEERKDFNPTAVFEPFLLTDKDGKARCTFKLPDTLTTYRITVFGVRGDLFSLKETEIAARNVVNVSQVQPRRLRERDTAEAGVLITNLDSTPHKVSVSASVEEAAGDNDESGMVILKGAAFIDGPAEHTITVKAGGNAVVYFDVAAERRGEINLVYTVNSGVLNERLVQSVIIEKPYITETVVTTGSLTEGSEESSAVIIPGFADDGEGSLAVTLDATRLSLLGAAVDYLFHYPYGCMEQRSGAVLPLVIFGEYIDALNLASEVSDPKKAARKEIASWAQVQRPDGGVPYWPSGIVSDPYVSLRIAHILAVAEEKNIALPPALSADRLYNYLYSEYHKLYRENSRLKTEAETGGRYFASYRRGMYLQSYMLYVFSLLKKPVDAARVSELTAANRDNPAALAFAGMTARAISRADIASAAARALRALMRPTARGVDLSGEEDAYAYYGGKTEQLALALQFFVDQYPGDDINTRLLYSLLSSKQAGGYWNNTAVTVRVLAAVDRLIQSENLDKTNVTGAAALDGRELLAGSFKGLDAKPVTETFRFKDFPLAALRRDSTLPFKVTRRGTGGVYWTAALSYALPAEMQGRRDEGIGVFQTVYDFESGEAVKGNLLESGKLYRAELRVSSGRDRTYLALRAPVPSGAEILDSRFVTTSSAAEDMAGQNRSSAGHAISNEAVFDNEIQYFWDSFEKGETTVNFLFRAARRGVYPTPPVQAECMYESEIFGRSDGALFTIK
ncbi:MAG: alpha-2-macroglobulin [Spirochaetaceae bacterium]|nr:alpha-2-macroglobulin [Spirochaetaceae bacterium]